MELVNSAVDWQRLGKSSGREHNNIKDTADIARKGIYVYLLDRKWQMELCVQRKQIFCMPDAVNNDDKEWAVNEFGLVELSEGRLRQRLLGLAANSKRVRLRQSTRPCNGNHNKIKGACRIQDEAVVLAVQDTIGLNYSTHHAMSGLGPINTHKDYA